MKLRTWAKENKKRILTAVSMGLLPVLFCTVYCAIYGKGLGDIYLPNSYWNDELFYFKQIEGILEHGVPGGYFGFNESSGRFLSFAAWSPVLLYVWVIWGFFCGWNMLSPIICNLVVISVSMAAFTWMAKPTRKQAISVAVLLGLCSPFTRYMMSMSLEVVCYSLLLIYVGALYGYEREKKKSYLWIMLGVSCVLTLTRPYFVLFVLYPAIIYGQKERRKWLVAVGAPLLSFCGYALLKYLSDLFDISFITTFWEEGIVTGIRNLWDISYGGILLILDYLKKGIKYGHFAGSMYAVYGILGCMLLVIVMLEWKRRKDNQICHRMFCMIFAMTVMMFAILYMYKVQEGARHLLAFVVVGILLLGMYEAKKGIVLQLMLAVAISFFFVVKAGTPYDYLVPFDDGLVREEVNAMNDSLEEKMVLKPGITWDNTVIWLGTDFVEGEVVHEAWQQLYAIPGGFGINLCAQTYVIDNWENIKSRYIAVIPGGDVEKQLLKDGAMLLDANDKIAVYDRRPDETN